MAEGAELRWADAPKAKDVRAAEEYLRLRYEEAQTARLVRKLTDGQVEEHRADDLLRACRLEPVAGTDPRVQKEVERVLAGKPLMPPLMVATARGAEIANGVHALSLAFISDPATPVPVVIARDF